MTIFIFTPGSSQDPHLLTTQKSLLYFIATFQFPIKKITKIFSTRNFDICHVSGLSQKCPGLGHLDGLYPGVPPPVRRVESLQVFVQQVSGRPQGDYQPAQDYSDRSCQVHRLIIGNVSSGLQSNSSLTFQVWISWDNSWGFISSKRELLCWKRLSLSSSLVVTRVMRRELQ